MNRPNITTGTWNDAPTGATMRDGYSQPFAVAQYGTANLIVGIFGDVIGGEETAKANGKAIAALPDLLEALEKSHEWTKALYAALPFDQNQEAMRCHRDQLKLVKSALIKAGYTF